MKLRIRSLELNETLKIELPSSCSLQQLKHLISQSFPPSSSIHVFLHRKDELQGCDETFQSFGIASGDLIFFTFKPNGFSISTVTHTPKSQPVCNSIPQIIPEPKIETNLDTHEGKTLNFEEGSEEFMDVDDVNFTKSFSVPGFLRKVCEHKLLVVALHAVFVEFGFVILDPVSLIASQIWKYWSLGVDASRMTLFYTGPELINSSNAIHAVELKFQCLGNFLIAHGLLSGGVSTRRVTLNKDKLVPFLNVVWANRGLQENGVVFETSPERKYFSFGGM